MMSMLAKDSVLFANETFYQALADGNFSLMDSLWSRESAVTCIHPGWHPLRTREQVMDVWRRMFANSNSTPVSCRAPEAFVTGETAFVVCYEQAPDVMLVATNIFKRERQQWRMVHHQSSPTTAAVSQVSVFDNPSLVVH
jgi:hypothetical protein